MTQRVIFTCGRESEYPRNAVILKALRQNFDVIEVTDQSSSLLVRYFKLIIKLFRSSREMHDLVFIGFHGHLLIFICNWLTRKPIVFDAFTSLYDTYCFDRNIFSPKSIFGKFTFWLDQKGIDLARIVSLDTKTHAQYYHNTFNIDEKKLRVFPVGCDEDLFNPKTESQVEPIVLYIGSYLPLHGVNVVIEAASIVQRKSKIRFLFIGRGIEYQNIIDQVKALRLKNCDFLPPIMINDLPNYISKSMIYLGGHFGNSAKARRVIAGKTYLSLAMAKPTIVGDNPANHELLTHKYDAWFCSMNDPDSLANAILTLEKDAETRNLLGSNAYRTFKEKAGINVISSHISQIIKDLL